MLGTSRPRSGGGKEGKQIEARLRKHFVRTEELVSQGIEYRAASAQAFNEIVYSDEPETPAPKKPRRVPPIIIGVAMGMVIFTLTLITSIQFRVL